MSQIHKYLEKKVFINDCQHSKNVSKRQAIKALKYLKRSQYTELYEWYHSKERLKKQYNKFKYHPIAELLLNKKVCSLKVIPDEFFKDYESESVNEGADIVLIDKMLHVLENTSEVAQLLDHACKLLDNEEEGYIVIKEWFSTENMMEVVDLFNNVILNSNVSLEKFINSTSLYLSFSDWKQLFEELGYKIKDTFFQKDMYQSFYFVLQKK